MSDSKKQEGENEQVTAKEVLKSLMLTRITVFLNTTNSDGEIHLAVGYLRGFSDDYIIIQEHGEAAKKPEDLTILFTESVQGLRKALPIE